MQIVTAHQGLLRTTRVDDLRGKGISLNAAGEEDRSVSSAEPRPGTFLTGLPLLDAIAPRGTFALGVVHELLYPPGMPSPRTFALLLAVAAAKARMGPVIWSDPEGTLYPPAVARAGLPMDRLLILRPKCLADELWAATQCMRCQGVAATIVEPGRLSRVQARRLQLAAETGGGAGLLLRPQRSATDYAAATRWLVQPEPSRRTRSTGFQPVNSHRLEACATTVQRWRVELIHGHGGRLRQAIILEVSREVLRSRSPDDIPRDIAAPHPVRAVDPMADRPDQASGGKRWWGGWVVGW